MRCRGWWVGGGVVFFLMKLIYWIVRGLGGFDKRGEV